MKTVYLIEAFGELCHAFDRTRSVDDKTPVIESFVKLRCSYSELEFTEKPLFFVISDELKQQGKEFLMFLMTSRYHIPEGRLVVEQKLDTDE